MSAAAATKPAFRVSDFVVPKKALHPLLVKSIEHFRPIVKLIQNSGAGKGLEWVMDMPADRFEHELFVCDEKTMDLEVSLQRRWIDKAGKPMTDPKTGKPISSVRRFLSAPFVLHGKSKVNGLGDAGEESPFGQKKSQDSRKAMTTNHPFADLVKDPENDKLNGWLRHQYKVASAFRRAVADMFIDNADLSIGPDMVEGKESELKIALAEARALAKTDRQAAIQRLYRRFNQLVKIPGETEWNPVERKKIQTGKKKNESESYMIFKTGFTFPMKEDYEKPENEPEEHPDPAVRDYMAALNAPDPKTKKPKLKIQVYQYPKIYLYSPARCAWVQMKPVDAEVSLHSKGCRIAKLTR